MVGSSAAATFNLSPGSTWFNPGGTNQFGGATNVLAKPGLFFYDLDYFAADKTERLIGVPEAAGVRVRGASAGQRTTCGMPPPRPGSTVRPTCATGSMARAWAQAPASG